MKVISHSIVSESLRPHGLYSPWNSPGQDTGVGSLCLSPGDLPNPEIEPESPALAGGFFTTGAPWEAERASRRGKDLKVTQCYKDGIMNSQQKFGSETHPV